jgi:hypothetical protein
MTPRTTLTALAAALLLSTAPARAARFDVIHVDNVNLTLCSGCGLTLAGSDFALLVNKGLTDITASEFFGATFTVTSSTGDLQLQPFVNNPGSPVAPILPNEAVGSVGALGPILTTLLLPGETFRNTAGMQVIAFHVDRLGPYVGPVTCNVTMRVGSEIASFVMHVDFKLGSHQIAFPAAGRVSSVAGPTATARTTWGRLKSLYR